LVEEMLSPEGVALLEKLIRGHVRKAAQSDRPAAKPQPAQSARKRAELEQIRALMKPGTLSQAVAQAAIEKAEEEIRATERLEPAKEERDAARVIRMLPRAAEVLRQRIRGGNLGLRDPRSIAQGRNTLYAMFGGKVQLRPAEVANGEKPYLIARVGLNRSVLQEVAGGCFQVGSGGRILEYPQE
jgi:hypothetical protein